MADKRRKSTAPGSETPAPDAIELPERWSVQRKMELVLRLRRGEPLDAVSRESQLLSFAKPIRRTDWLIPCV